MENNIESKIEAARGELSRLQEAASDAAAEAERWEKTFERDPSDEAFTRKAVTRQRAENARAAMETHERDVLGALLLEQRRTKLATIDRSLAASEAAVRQRFANALSTIAAGVRQLDAAIGALAEQHEPRLTARRDGVLLRPLSLREIITDVSSELEPLTGGAHELEHTHAHISFEQEKTVALRFNRPATAVPSPLR